MTILNGLKCFDKFYLHQNYVEEQDFVKATLINFELKGRLNFLRNLLNNLQERMKRRIITKIEKVWLNSKTSIIRDIKSCMKHKNI